MPHRSANEESEMEEELRAIIQEAWCEGDKEQEVTDTFGAFLDRAALAILNAGYTKKRTADDMETKRQALRDYIARLV